ncbi:MAG TPA: hypothetical protein DEP19_02440 [Anaerolineae bacterium]|nr:hypothetical protein [Anaerolineae bacterium]HCK66673.1 hypothetical protein [Anaerolineae bacterium]
MSRKPLLLTFAILLIVQLACNAPSNSATPDTFATLNALYTASALTVEAGGTATPGLPLPTATIGTAAPTNTAGTQSAGVTSKCDAAQFLADVTYPDGSTLAPNTSFVKIWRIKNVGTCTWTTSYALVFFGGDAMSAPSAVALAGSVAPGQYIEIPVTLKSPNSDGNFTGYWKLRNASGNLFGIGTQADTAFWVKIKVTGPAYVAYNFANNYCQAEWSNGNSMLLCPGTEGDANGYVIKLNKPKFENGTNSDDVGLLSVPRGVRNGIISGQFPAFTVQTGDRFRALVYCQHQATKCNVTFKLNYLNNGQIKTLGTWNEAYEGKYYTIDLNLNSLAGETLKFILEVNANGGHNEDYAIWLNPRIVRVGNPPPSMTASRTPTITLTPTSTFTTTSTFTLTPTETPTETPTP